MMEHSIRYGINLTGQAMDHLGNKPSVRDTIYVKRDDLGREFTDCGK